MLFFGRPWQSPLNTREPSVLSRGKRLFIVAAPGSDPQPRFIHDVVDLEKLLYLLDLASRRRRGDDAALFQYRKGGKFVETRSKAHLVEFMLRMTGIGFGRTWLWWWSGG
jgi:hypothetical protein